MREGKGVSVSPLKSTVVNQGIRTHVDSRSPELVPEKVIPAMRQYDLAKRAHGPRNEAGQESPDSLRRPGSPDSTISTKSTEPRMGKLEKRGLLSDDQRKLYETKLNGSRSDLRGEIRGKNLPPRILEPESPRGFNMAEAPQQLTRSKRVRDHSKLMLTQAEARVKTLEARVNEYEAKVGRSGSTKNKIKETFGLKKSATELSASLAGFRNQLAAARTKGMRPSGISRRPMGDIRRSAGICSGRIRHRATSSNSQSGG